MQCNIKLFPAITSLYRPVWMKERAECIEEFPDKRLITNQQRNNLGKDKPMKIFLLLSSPIKQCGARGKEIYTRLKGYSHQWGEMRGKFELL